LKKLEDLHVAFWLAKDHAWCSTTKWLGLAMVLPTILVAAKIARDSRKDDDDFAHNIAVCCWHTPDRQNLLLRGIGILLLHYAIVTTRRLRDRFRRQS
jgi:hypothetical protein